MFGLMHGVRRFQARDFKDKEPLFEQLSGGQNPDILYITCSDSRIDPHLITNSEPGELFIMRNAGNIIPVYAPGSSEAGTIEYALTALDIKDVVICGHSHCGAMTGLLHPEKLEDMPAVKAWLTHASGTLTRMRSRFSHLSDDALLPKTIEENVLIQIENLKTHPCVRAKLERGELKIHGWVYHLKTGAVHTYQPKKEVFLPLDPALFRLSRMERHKLHQIVNEEAKRYLAAYANPKNAFELLTFTKAIEQITTKGASLIWDKIFSQVAKRMQSESASRYRHVPKSVFMKVVELGKATPITGLDAFQASIESSSGYQQYCSQLLRFSTLFKPPKVDAEKTETSLALIKTC